MMNSRKDITNVFLKDEINKLISKFSSIRAIYLFGSRAYKTNSIRSDIDLLIYCSEPISLQEFPNICHPAVDLFDTTSLQNARSYSNNSTVFKRDSYDSIIEQIDAKLLWDIENGYNNENLITYNRQPVLQKVQYIKSVLEYTPLDKDKNIPIIELGSDIPRFLQILAENITTGIECTKQLNKTKAKNIITPYLKLEDEYDFQNLIYLICKPWFHDIESEPFVVKSNDIERKADFGLSGNRIIIEAKHIRDTNTKNIVIKQLEGIKKYYKENPTIVGILFLILYEKSVFIDKVKLKQTDNEQVYIHFIENCTDL